MENLLEYCRKTSDEVRRNGSVNFKEVNSQQKLDDFESAYVDFERTVTQDYERRFREASERGQKFFTLLRYKTKEQPTYGTARKFSASTILYGVSDNREESGLSRLRNFFEGFSVTLRHDKKTGFSTLTVSPFFPKKKNDASV